MLRLKNYRRSRNSVSGTVKTFGTESNVKDGMSYRFSVNPFTLNLDALTAHMWALRLISPEKGLTRKEKFELIEACEKLTIATLEKVEKAETLKEVISANVAAMLVNADGIMHAEDASEYTVALKSFVNELMKEEPK